MASISRRQYIRWGSEPASEPTSTTVLTSPERRFVDIRILHAAPEGQDTHSCGDTSDDAGGGQVPLSRLDWAFAGHSHSQPRDRHSSTTHTVWRHFVDSRTRHPEAVVDQADIIGGGGDDHDHDRDHDPGLALERGRMVNPATGIETAYEEAWRDCHPDRLPHHRGYDCAVLELCDDASAARGLVVLLGRLCQGVMRLGDRFGLEQWEWRDELGWARQHRLGDLVLPCSQAAAAVVAGELEPGASLTAGGHSWTVAEISRFSPEL